MFPLRVLGVMLSLVAIAACTDTGHVGRAAGTSTTTTTTSAPAEPVVHARYTCGPTDGPYITVGVRTGHTLTVMSELAVAGVVRGRSARVLAPAGVETSVNIDPLLMRFDVLAGGTVRLYRVDARGGTPRLLTSEPLALRLPPGSGCGCG